MRVLITGGSGFIGTNLVSFYLEQGVEVCNFDIAPPRNKDHMQFWKNVDVLDFENFRRETLNFSPTHIVNLAAQTGTIDKGRTIDDYAVNFKGVENLIDISKEVPSLQRIIFTSSMLVCKPGYLPKNYEDYCPPNPYGESKVRGEKLVRRRATDLSCSWLIVRPIGIWGPWFDIPYRNFFLSISRGLYVHPGKRGTLQSLGFVGNTVYQFHKLTIAPPEKVNGKVFYLGDWPPLNLRDWANSIQNAFGSRSIPTVPIWLLKILAKIGDMAHFLGWEDPILTSSRLKNMLTDMVYDIDPFLVEDLPYTLEDGVRITVDWLRKQGFR